MNTQASNPEYLQHHPFAIQDAELAHDMANAGYYHREHQHYQNLALDVLTIAEDKGTSDSELDELVLIAGQAIKEQARSLRDSGKISDEVLDSFLAWNGSFYLWGIRPGELGPDFDYSSIYKANALGRAVVAISDAGSREKAVEMIQEEVDYHETKAEKKENEILRTAIGNRAFRARARQLKKHDRRTSRQRLSPTSHSTDTLFLTK